MATATCRLLALAPQLRVDSEPVELFVQQAIVVLFQLSFRTDQPQVAIEALRFFFIFSKIFKESIIFHYGLILISSSRQLHLGPAMFP